MAPPPSLSFILPLSFSLERRISLVLWRRGAFDGKREKEWLLLLLLLLYLSSKDRCQVKKRENSCRRAACSMKCVMKIYGIKGNLSPLIVLCRDR